MVYLKGEREDSNCKDQRGMMKKVFYYPAASSIGYGNPYSINYKKALESFYVVLDKEHKRTRIQGLSLLLHAFKADIVILNWIESIAVSKLGKLQYLLARMALTVSRLRKKKIVWMFHNIRPHEGHSKQSKSMHNYLFKHADLIISHSKAATAYAKERATHRVLYRCHPIQMLQNQAREAWEPKELDVLMWGAIIPYKGIAEFLAEKGVQESNLKVLVVGECRNKRLQTEIEKHCTERIRFENRYANFDELQGLIHKSRYVLFPYVGECVSSSGVLIDTLAMGGNLVGPNIGAFKDLSEEGLCLTYTNYNELLTILNSENSINSARREQFIKENSWNNFAQFLKSELAEK